MAYGDKVQQPGLPFAPTGDARRDLEESAKLQRRIDLLLAAIGDRARCAGCNEPIVWVQHKNGAKAPYNADASNHFGTCPERDRFRRGTDGKTRT